MPNEPVYTAECRFAIPESDFRSVISSTGHTGGGSPSDPVSEAFFMGLILGSAM